MGFTPHIITTKTWKPSKRECAANLANLISKGARKASEQLHTSSPSPETKSKNQGIVQRSFGGIFTKTKPSKADVQILKSDLNRAWTEAEYAECREQDIARRRFIDHTPSSPNDLRAADVLVRDFAIITNGGDSWIRGSPLSQNPSSLGASSSIVSGTELGSSSEIAVQKFAAADASRGPAQDESPRAKRATNNRFDQHRTTSSLATPPQRAPRHITEVYCSALTTPTTMTTASSSNASDPGNEETPPSSLSSDSRPESPSTASPDALEKLQRGLEQQNEENIDPKEVEYQAQLAGKDSVQAELAARESIHKDEKATMESQHEAQLTQMTEALKKQHEQALADRDAKRKARVGKAKIIYKLYCDETRNNSQLTSDLEEFSQELRNIDRTVFAYLKPNDPNVDILQNVISLVRAAEEGARQLADTEWALQVTTNELDKVAVRQGYRIVERERDNLRFRMGSSISKDTLTIVKQADQIVKQAAHIVRQAAESTELEEKSTRQDILIFKLRDLMKVYETSPFDGPARDARLLSEVAFLMSVRVQQPKPAATTDGRDITGKKIKSPSEDFKESMLAKLRRNAPTEGSANTTQQPTPFGALAQPGNTAIPNGPSIVSTAPPKKSSSADLVARVRALEDESKILNRQVTDLTKQLTDGQAEINRLRGLRDIHDIQDLVRENSQQMNQIRDLEDQVEDLSNLDGGQLYWENCQLDQTNIDLQVANDALQQTNWAIEQDRNQWTDQTKCLLGEIAVYHWTFAVTEQKMQEWRERSVMPNTSNMQALANIEDRLKTMSREVAGAIRNYVAACFHFGFRFKTTPAQESLLLRGLNAGIEPSVLLTNDGDEKTAVAAGLAAVDRLLTLVSDLIDGFHELYCQIFSLGGPAVTDDTFPSLSKAFNDIVDRYREVKMSVRAMPSSETATAMQEDRHAAIAAAIAPNGTNQHPAAPETNTPSDPEEQYGSVETFSPNPLAQAAKAEVADPKQAAYETLPVHQLLDVKGKLEDLVLEVGDLLKELGSTCAKNEIQLPYNPRIDDCLQARIIAIKSERYRALSANESTFAALIVTNGKLVSFVNDLVDRLNYFHSVCLGYDVGVLHYTIVSGDLSARVHAVMEAMFAALQIGPGTSTSEMAELQQQAAAVENDETLREEPDESLQEEPDEPLKEDVDESLQEVEDDLIPYDWDEEQGDEDEDRGGVRLTTCAATMNEETTQQSDEIDIWGVNDLEAAYFAALDLQSLDTSHRLPVTFLGSGIDRIPEMVSALGKGVFKSGYAA